jgi:hypothetical protein
VGRAHRTDIILLGVNAACGRELVRPDRAGAMVAHRYESSDSSTCGRVFDARRSQRRLGAICCKRTGGSLGQALRGGELGTAKRWTPWRAFVDPSC